MPDREIFFLVGGGGVPRGNRLLCLSGGGGLKPILANLLSEFIKSLNFPGIGGGGYGTLHLF